MNAFTMFKYAQSQKEEDIERIIYLLNTGDYDRLSEACDDAGVDPRSLTQKDIAYIQSRVD